MFKLGRVKTGWDFPESVLLSDSSGSYSVCVDNLIAGVLASVASSQSGQVSQLQAQESSLPDESVSVWFTDPPYYDAIPYADLADFFLVWLNALCLAILYFAIRSSQRTRSLRRCKKPFRTRRKK